jgi:zinc transporter, ZIP family
MLEAAGWGLVGASSLLIGAILGVRFRFPPMVVGLILAFGAGALISALAFELTEEAFKLGGADAVAIGLAAGALTYFAGDWLIDRRGGEMRMSQMGEQSETTSKALLLGAVLDGIPESMVIGMGLIEGAGVSIPVLAAVFLSNLPESLSASSGRSRANHRPGTVLITWVVVVVVCGISAGVGYAALKDASDDAIALLLSFAAGAVLTMLADTMMPEAFKHGGRAAGLVTVLGFALAFLLSTLE